VVAEGSRLIGPVVPSADGSGWWALLYLTGGPETVLDRYVAQGSELGYREALSSTIGNKYPRTSFPGVYDTAARCAERPFGAYACATTLRSKDRPQCVVVRVLRSGPDPDGQLSQDPISHVQLQSGPTSGGGCAAEVVYGDPDADPPAAAMVWPSLPVEGDPLTGGVVVDYGPGTYVLPGSRVVSTRGIDDHQPFCRPAALLEVAAPDRIRVVESYVDSFTSAIPGLADHVSRSERVEGSVRYHFWQVAVPRVDSFEATLVEGTDGRAWLRVRQCGSQGA
jgi:hypothetical protein